MLFEMFGISDQMVVIFVERVIETVNVVRPPVSLLLEEFP